MKLFLTTLALFSALILSACSTLQVEKLTDRRVMITKNVTVLFFTSGTVYTCELTEKATISSCVENFMSKKSVSVWEANPNPQGSKLD